MMAGSLHGGSHRLPAIEDSRFRWRDLTGPLSRPVARPLDQHVVGDVDKPVQCTFREDFISRRSGRRGFTSSARASSVPGKGARGTFRPNAVLVTMDDAYREVRSVALPLLKKYDVPAIVFVPIRWVDRAPNIMSLNDLRVVQSNGVEVQSHTWNMHCRIRKPDGTAAAVVWTMSESEMQSDTARSREVYKGWFGREPDMLAYPYGAFTPELIGAARSEGIRFGFTTQPGLVARDTPDMSLPRLNAGLRGQSGEDVVRMILQHARAGT